MFSLLIWAREFLYLPLLLFIRIRWLWGKLFLSLLGLVIDLVWKVLVGSRTLIEESILRFSLIANSYILLEFFSSTQVISVDILILFEGRYFIRLLLALWQLLQLVIKFLLNFRWYMLKFLWLLIISVKCKIFFLLNLLFSWAFLW